MLSMIINALKVHCVNWWSEKVVIKLVNRPGYSWLDIQLSCIKCTAPLLSCLVHGRFSYAVYQAIILDRG